MRHARVDGVPVAPPLHLSRTTRSGGSRSSTCTSSRSCWTSSARSPRSTPCSTGSSRRPSRVDRRTPLVRPVAARFAAARGRAVQRPRRPAAGTRGAGRAWTRARSWLQRRALGSRLRPAQHRRRRTSRARSLAFVHRAFWRSERRRRQRRAVHRSGAESTRGRLPEAGSSTSASGRRRTSARGGGGIRCSATPVRASRAPHRGVRVARCPDVLEAALARAARAADARSGAATDSAPTRRSSGCDCWPIIRDELAGIALLQWPWSARAMDEARRRARRARPVRRADLRRGGRLGPRHRARVPAARHPDGRPAARLHLPALAELPARARRDVAGDPEHPADAGFPHPVRDPALRRATPQRHLSRGATFRTAAARHRQPRLDDLLRTMRQPVTEDVARARAEAGARASGCPGPGHDQMEGSADSPAPVPRTRPAALPGVHVAIKAHPAETPEAYARRPRTALPRHRPARGSPAGAAARRQPCRRHRQLHRCARRRRARVPALVIGLPNNLSPFVEAGMMAGSEDDPADALSGFSTMRGSGSRCRRRQAFLSRFHIGSDGRAAERSAAAVLSLVEEGRAGGS